MNNNLWYENPVIDQSIVISSRVRLARNIKKYPFSGYISNEQTENMINETVQSVKNAQAHVGLSFNYINLDEKTETEKRALQEKHIISPELLKSNKKKGLLQMDDETVSIMLNEEDHIRIQSIFAGDNIDAALSVADKVDDLIEDSVEYAFDKDFGYLTSCPTNTGTGLRASFMIHVPMLERTGQLKNIMQALIKFGMTLRGIYGEGTEPLGSIYQVSNQLTMGKNEQEITGALKNVTSQIKEKEAFLVENAMKIRKVELEDRIYRAYGILTNARSLNGKEAMSLLSDIRLGYMYNILNTPKPKLSIYNIMMNIQAGSLQQMANRELNEAARDYYRAEYIRKSLTT